MELLVFGWTDYTLFGCLLGLSLMIGFYFGFCSKQNSVNEYLFGGKTMGYIPVSISLLASSFSGVTLLGSPTEVYLHGAYFLLSPFVTILDAVFVSYISAPLFYNLRISSTYDYLEQRFSKEIKVFSSILYIMAIITYVPLVIYGPAIAFAQVTGISLYIIAPTVCFICITYTTMVNILKVLAILFCVGVFGEFALHYLIGGVKAVIWTDTLQFIFTLGGILTVLIVGLDSLGGFSNMWRISTEGGRLDIFDFNLDPTLRNTFWMVTVGSYISSLTYAAFGQKFVQRYFSIGNLKDIRKAIWLSTWGAVFIMMSSTITGLIMYAKYHDCDPIGAKLVERSDQILPFYMLETTKNLPGISGIFLASITSSGLSVMSASMNTLSGIIYHTFFESCLPESSNKESRAAAIMKGISFCIGIISIGLIFALEYLGTIIEMTFSIRGAIDGPTVAFFLMGMFLPWVGKRGAYVGGLVSFVVMLWIGVVAKWHTMNSRIRYSNLPLSTENCTAIYNITVIQSSSTPLPLLDPEDGPALIYRISFYYYVLLGAIIAIVTALITSYVTQEVDLHEINPDHIVPFMRRFLPEKKYEEVPVNELTKEEKTSTEKSVVP